VLESTDACSMIVTPNTELADRFLVEIGRGCPIAAGSASSDTRPAGEARPFEAIAEMIERAGPLTNRFGLIAGPSESIPTSIAFASGA